MNLCSGVHLREIKVLILRYPKVVLKKIFNKLDRAQEVIRKCYFELENLGIVKFTEASSQTPDGLCFTGNKPEDDELYETETKLAIRFLEKKAKAENIDITDQALAYIAIRANTRVRDLEGALSRVVAYSELASEEITVNMVEDVLKDVYPEKK